MRATAKGQRAALDELQVRRLKNMLADRSILVVSGAGLSTDCGIPDYRGTGASDEPSVDLEQFRQHAYWRNWVWERNQATWQIFQNLLPSPGHRVLAAMQGAGIPLKVSTQNVDGLHEKAGTRFVYPLHGSYDLAECLHCGEEFNRRDIDSLMQALNPDLERIWDPAQVAILAKADLAKAQASTFSPSPCPECGGILKPGITFFGESLPQVAMEASLEAARESEVCLVLGSSLLVSTGMWVVQAAVHSGARLVIINRGPTAADDFADLRIEGGTSEYLSALLAALDIPYLDPPA